MDGKLKEEARYFEFDLDEVEKDHYACRADMTFWPRNTCEIKEFASPFKGIIEITKEEILHKAGFRIASSFSAGQIFKEVSLAGQFIGTEYHIPKYWIDSYCLNVRFLASFITEAGILLRSGKNGISVKAHRMIAMGFKTARTFGLMPFTTMGTKQFVFARTMEDL
ncbi:uncharacterized protein [Solanum lycopersicum]|uniref:Small ribosomal subunit protein bS18c n=1 Tax=Solanum lycopersicum TaxID=4081 RepID=A0A3Q7EY71_SOLLC